MNENILIIGGYGTVGGVISKHLSGLFPHKIVVAGSKLQQSTKTGKGIHKKFF